MATPDDTNPEEGRARTGLYLGALATQAVVVALLWLFGWYFGT